MFMAILKRQPALNDVGALDNFPGNSTSFKFKQKITGSTGDDGTKNVEIMLPSKYLSNFWRTLEIYNSLIVNLISFLLGLGIRLYLITA